MLVEAVEEPRRPRAVAFEQADAQVGKSFEHASRGETCHHEHDAERLIERMPQHGGAEMVAEREVRFEVRLAPAVETRRHVEPNALAPNGVVHRIVPRTPIGQAGRQERGLEAQIADTAREFVDRAGNIVRCQHRRAVHAVGQALAARECQSTVLRQIGGKRGVHLYSSVPI